MYLVELLLPLNDNSGKPFDVAEFDAVRQHLTELRRSHGLHPLPRPGHHHGPRHDSARRDRRVRSHDEHAGRLMVGSYRLHLEREFRQDEIVVRASFVTLL
jgi:hypothetical protein